MDISGLIGEYNTTIAPSCPISLNNFQVEDESIGLLMEQNDEIIESIGDAIAKTKQKDELSFNMFFTRMVSFKYRLNQMLIKQHRNVLKDFVQDIENNVEVKLTKEGIIHLITQILESNNIREPTNMRQMIDERFNMRKSKDFESNWVMNVDCFLEHRHTGHSKITNPTLGLSLSSKGEHIRCFENRQFFGLTDSFECAKTINYPNLFKDYREIQSPNYEHAKEAMNYVSSWYGNKKAMPSLDKLNSNVGPRCGSLMQVCNKSEIKCIKDVV